VDPLTDLQEATERNVREAREEWEEVERQKAEAAKVAQADATAQVDAAAKAQADAAAKVQAEEAARGRTPQLVIPLRTVPPAPENPALTRGASNDQPAVDRRGGDAIVPRAEVPPQALTAEARGSQSDVPPAPPVSGELVLGATPVVCPLGHRRAAKAASMPRAQETGAASSSTPDAEATSAVLPEWTPGGGMGVLNKAAQDVQAQLQAQGTAFQQYTKAFLATRTAVRVRFFALFF
jgi:hypothetical protein